MATVSVRYDEQVLLPPEIRAAYHLTEGSVLEILPLGADRFEVRVVATRLPLLALLDEFADDGEPPDIALEREALGAALDTAIVTGGHRP